MGVSRYFSERLAGKRTFNLEVSQTVRNCIEALTFSTLPAQRGDAIFAKNAAGAPWEVDFPSLMPFFNPSRAFATEPTETNFLIFFGPLPLPVTGWRLSAEGFALEMKWFLGQMLRRTCFG